MSKSPLVSVVIPLYNQSCYIGIAVESVIAQTFTDWELIVVDDGSTDGSAGIVKNFRDERIKYFYQPNAGLPAARNTGIDNARGEYLAFLDSDDYFASNKLASQTKHLQQAPEVGLSFASRIDVDAENNPLWLLPAPQQATLSSLLTGFPFTINDLLVRRSWVEKVNAFDESYCLHGEDRNFYLRLYAAGCQFASVDGFLAYRRLHKTRIVRRIPERLAIMKRAIDEVAAMPQLAVSDETLYEAYANIFMSWALQSFAQKETELGQKYLNAAVTLNRTLAEDDFHKMQAALTWFALRDGSDHEQMLRNIVKQLQPRYAPVQSNLNTMIGRGYICRGFCDLLWKRNDHSVAFFASAKQFNAKLDSLTYSRLTNQLNSFEKAFGLAKTAPIVDAFAQHLIALGDAQGAQQMLGKININRAYLDYQNELFASVPKRVGQAVQNDLSYLKNRGVWSILLRSFVKNLWLRA